MTKEKTKEEVLNILDKHMDLFVDSPKLQKAIDLIMEKTVFDLFDDIEKLKHNLLIDYYNNNHNSPDIAFHEGIGIALEELNKIKQKWLNNGKKE